MRRLCLIGLGWMALALAGCVSAFSVRIDARPALTASELSAKLEPKYLEWGYRVDEFKRPDSYLLGAWHGRRGFIGHDEREGVLWIWIAPPPQSDTGATVVADIQKALAELAPSAVVTIRESRTPDWR